MKKLNEMKKFSELIKNVNYSKLQNHGWLLKYAQKNFEFAKDYVEYLDQKAESIVKYLGLGSLLAILFSPNLKALFCYVPKVIFVIGIFSWVISALMALITRNPLSIKYPNPIYFAFKHGEKYKEAYALKIRLAGGYEKAFISQIVAGRKKAKLLQLSYCFFMVAIFAFLLSIFLWLV